MKWLPNMDLNHDKQIQRLLCYRYTIRQMGGQIYGVCGESQADGRAALVKFAARVGESESGAARRTPKRFARFAGTLALPIG
jgi:hypothetical protein